MIPITCTIPNTYKKQLKYKADLPQRKSKHSRTDGRHRDTRQRQALGLCEHIVDRFVKDVSFILQSILPHRSNGVYDVLAWQRSRLRDVEVAGNHAAVLSNVRFALGLDFRSTFLDRSKTNLNVIWHFEESLDRWHRLVKKWGKTKRLGVGKNQNISGGRENDVNNRWIHDWFALCEALYKCIDATQYNTEVTQKPPWGW